MIFLANLVGSEHIERFIPLAEPQSGAAPAQSAADGGVTGTREMPKFTGEMRPAASSIEGSQVARVERKGGAGTKASAKAAAKKR